MDAATLLAQGAPEMLVPVMIALGTGALLFFMLLTLMLRQYKRCPPNRIMVVFGKAALGAPAICVHGGARLIVPLFQDVAWLSLEPIRVEMSRQVTSSGKTIGDPLPRVFSVAIGTTPELMQAAAVRLLGLYSEQIQQQAEDLIVAQLDRLLDAIEAGEIRPASDEYYDRLETSIGAELAQLGLVLINVRRE